jgi:hypothetical protein
MPVSRRIPVRTLACALAVASLGVTGTAQAKHGGPTRTPTPPPTTQPPATPPAALCPPDTAVAPDGSYSFGQQVGSAGCVVLHTAGGVNTLERVITAPGWTANVKVVGGTTNRSRVQVQFTSAGQKLDFRSEAGKTVVN